MGPICIGQLVLEMNSVCLVFVGRDRIVVRDQKGANCGGAGRASPAHSEHSGLLHDKALVFLARSTNARRWTKNRTHRHKRAGNILTYRKGKVVTSRAHPGRAGLRFLLLSRPAPWDPVRPRRARHTLVTPRRGYPVTPGYPGSPLLSLSGAVGPWPSQGTRRAAPAPAPGGPLADARERERD